jgi:hypothetical protein
VESDGPGLPIPAHPAQLTAESPVRSALLPHAVLATGDDRTVELAALLGTHTGRSLLPGKLLLVSVAVGSELTQGPGYLTGRARWRVGVTRPRCSPDWDPAVVGPAVAGAALVVGPVVLVRERP